VSLNGFLPLVLRSPLILFVVVVVKGCDAACRTLVPEVASVSIANRDAVFLERVIRRRSGGDGDFVNCRDISPFPVLLNCFVLFFGRDS
jgi:hypothetical protein